MDSGGGTGFDPGTGTDPGGDNVEDHVPGGNTGQIPPPCYKSLNFNKDRLHKSVLFFYFVWKTKSMKNILIVITLFLMFSCKKESNTKSAPPTK